MKDSHPSPFWRDKAVCITGGSGFLGRVVTARLAELQPRKIIIPRRRDCDLTDAAQIRALFDREKPDIIIHLAAEVGGIGANRERPGRFFYANMLMGMNLIEQSRLSGVWKFAQVGTVCGYPKFCPAPFHEEDLWNGYPEETNASYGIAKRALWTLLDAYQQEYGFRSTYLLPVNLFGPGDNFNLSTSHVIPALIRKFTEAVEEGRDSVECWGSGEVTREFLFVDDAAAGILRAAEVLETPDPVNLGTGREIRIRDLAHLIARMIGFGGRITWNTAYPDGQPRRHLDLTRARERLNWRPSVDLEEGLKRTIDWWDEQRMEHTRKTAYADS